MTASSEIPNFRPSRSGRLSLDQRTSVRQSAEVQRALSASATDTPKVPLLAIQQADSEDSRELAEDGSVLHSHRVCSSLPLIVLDVLVMLTIECSLSVYGDDSCQGRWSNTLLLI